MRLLCNVHTSGVCEACVLSAKAPLPSRKCVRYLGRHVHVSVSLLADLRAPITSTIMVAREIIAIAMVERDQN